MTHGRRAWMDASAGVRKSAFGAASVTLTVAFMW